MRERAAAKLGRVGRVVPKAAEQGVQSRSEGGQFLLPTRRSLGGIVGRDEAGPGGLGSSGDLALSTGAL